MLIRLAVSNLLRGRRRSVLLIVFIAVCAASLSLFLGYTEYSRRGIKLGAVAQSGHAAAASREYWEAALGSGAESDMDAAAVSALEAALADMPVSTEKVLEFGGILGSENRSAVFSGTAYENESSTLTAFIDEGRGIFGDDSGFIMMGRLLAKILEAGPGDSVQLSAYSPYGLVLYSQDISGTLSFNNIFADKSVVMTNIANAWDMLGSEGSATRLRIRIAASALQKGREAELLGEMRRRVEENFPGLALKTWRELSPIYEGVINQYNAIFGFLLINFFVFIFAAVMQSVINISLERTREFGTLRALGISRFGLGLLVMQEMLIITLLGMLLGAGLVGLGSGLSRILDLKYVPPAATEGFPIEFFFVTSDLLLVVVLPIFGIVVLSALYPVIRIARMEVTRVLEG